MFFDNDMLYSFLYRIQSEGIHVPVLAGIAHATDQIIDLISNGERGIHIYTMNKPEIAGAIIKNVDEIIRATKS